MRMQTRQIEVAAACAFTLFAVACRSASSSRAVVPDDRVVVAGLPPGVSAIRVNGTILTYRDSTSATSASRIPVVFIHGTNTGLDMAPAQFRAFAGRGRTLTYSRRFHAPNPVSSDDTATYSAALHADDLAAFLRATKSAPADIVGSSYGGLVALVLAMRHPEVVHSLVLAEPAVVGALAGTPSGDSLRHLAYNSLAPARGLMQRGDSAGAVAMFGDITGGPGSFARLPAGVQQYLLGYRGELARELAAPEDAWLPPLDCNELKNIKTPTLVLLGDHGQRLFGIASRTVARCLPNARLEVIPNSGHVIAIDNPAPFTNSVKAFLDSLPR